MLSLLCNATSLLYFTIHSLSENCATLSDVLLLIVVLKTCEEDDVMVSSKNSQTWSSTENMLLMEAMEPSRVHLCVPIIWIVNSVDPGMVRVCSLRL